MANELRRILGSVFFFGRIICINETVEFMNVVDGATLVILAKAGTMSGVGFGDEDAERGADMTDGCVGTV